MDHAQPAVSVARPDSEVLTEVTKYLAGVAEWAVPAFLASSLVYSFIYDPYTHIGHSLIAALIVIHLALIRPFRHGYGPFYRGGRWPLLAIGAAFAVNALVALVSTPGTYGNNRLGIPSGSYQNGIVLFMAFSPWLSQRLRPHRRLIEAGVIALLVFEWLMLIWFANGQITLHNLRACGMILLTVITAYLLGLAVGQMCAAAALRQAEIQGAAFSQFFSFLHSHVKAGIAGVSATVRGNVPAQEALRALDDTVSNYRLELLLSRGQVPLATVLSERIRAFTGSFVVGDTPRVGAVTVPQPIAELLSRALGDLLSNSVKYGARRVDIDLDFPDDDTIRLIVADDGPGFSAEELANPANSLNALLHAAERLGGQLAKPATASGATLIMTLPMASEVRG